MQWYFHKKTVAAIETGKSDWQISFMIVQKKSQQTYFLRKAALCCVGSWRTQAWVCFGSLARVGWTFRKKAVAAFIANEACFGTARMRAFKALTFANFACVSMNR